MPDPLPPWVANYVGLPWKVLGRDRDGLDCYGLVRLVLAEKFGITLPALRGGWTSERRASDLNRLAALIGGAVAECCAHNRWHAVDPADAPRAGDVAKFLLHGRPIHVGLVVGQNWFLHVREGADSAVERLDGRMWRTRLVCLYRYGSLA